MKSITILQPNNESLVAQLGSFYNAFKGVSFGEKLEFDLSYLNWVFPLLILPISAYINETQSEVKIDTCNIKSYLEKISFPKGVNSISSFQRQIQKYKTYIPISVLNKEKTVDRERLESLFSEKIYKTLGNISGAQNAVCYPIAELITNIFEHSKKESGFVFGQFYPNKNYLDICIADCGRGFANTYKEEKELKLSDAEAITEAMEGNSVKKDKERGYGIRTSKDIVCKALKEMKRVLKPNGWMIAKVPSGSLLYRIIFHLLSPIENRPYEAWFCKKDWQKLVINENYQNVDISKCGSVLTGFAMRIHKMKNLLNRLPAIGRIYFLIKAQK